MMEKETPSNQPQKIALCPNGCGTKLVMRRFVEVFDENMRPQLDDAYENLYCTKCHTRWIPEPHSPLASLIVSGIEKTHQTHGELNDCEKVTFNIPKKLLFYYQVRAMLHDTKPEEEIEYDLFDKVKADLEEMRAVDLLNLEELVKNLPTE